MPSAEQIDEALRPVWMRICDRLRGADPARLPEDEREFAAIWILRSEIDNGGFAQYMFNSTGDEWATARRALGRLGSKRLVDLFEDFLNMLPGAEPGATKEERQLQLDALASKYGEAESARRLSVLDNRFYGLKAEVRERLYEFAREAGWLRKASGDTSRLGTE